MALSRTLVPALTAVILLVPFATSAQPAPGQTAQQTEVGLYADFMRLFSTDGGGTGVRLTRTVSRVMAWEMTVGTVAQPNDARQGMMTLGMRAQLTPRAGGLGLFATGGLAIAGQFDHAWSPMAGIGVQRVLTSGPTHGSRAAVRVETQRLMRCEPDACRRVVLSGVLKF